MSTKEEIKALWKMCFNDSDEFVDLYFENRYKDEINMDIRCDGKVVSALQMIPYPMTFCGGTIPVSYISGACTHPEYRGRGLMRKLLSEVHRRMYQDGVLLGLLIPAKEWLFDFYAQSGYAPCFGYVNKQFRVNELRPSYACVVSDEKDDVRLMPEHYRYFSGKMKARPCCVLHPCDDFRIILADLRLENGNLWVARKNGSIVGMAFCVVESSRLVVKEILADDDATRDALMREAAMYHSVSELECLLPSFVDSLYLGMARVIHAERLLNIVARKYPSLELYVEIEEDKDLPENEGGYAIVNGVCKRGKIPGKEYRKCSLSDFARLLLEAEHPYMSLMLD